MAATSSMVIIEGHRRPIIALVRLEGHDSTELEERETHKLLDKFLIINLIIYCTIMHVKIRANEQQ